LPTNLRTVLARATRPAHAALEAEMRLQGEVPLPRYLAYLRAMHAIVHAVEADVAIALEALGLDARARARRAWLERDLAHFGAPPLRMAPLACVPRTHAERLGWAYVLEGSTLGGRVLYERLAPRLALTPQGGGAFLFGHGERTEAMWREFVDALNGARPRARAIEESAGAATQAFVAIGEAFRASVAGADLGIQHDRARRGLAA
jgi:heme oxygenase